MGGSIIMDVIGILVGHLFHFCADIVPLAYGTTVLWCPGFMCG
jgi:hypothetical protein